MVKVLLQRLRKGGTLRLLANRIGDHADFPGDPGGIMACGQLDHGHARGRNDRKRLRRPRTLFHQDQIGMEREHAFRRELPHIADIGFLPRGRRIAGGGIAPDDAVLLPERIEDFGDRAADGHDPLGQRCRQNRARRGQNGQGHGQSEKPPSARAGGGVVTVQHIKIPDEYYLTIIVRNR